MDIMAGETNMSKEEQSMGWASKAMQQIENDLRGRRGLKNEWDSVDEDVRDEIRDTWTGIVIEAASEDDIGSMESRVDPQDEVETDRFLAALGTAYREEIARKIATECSEQMDRLAIDWEFVEPSIEFSDLIYSAVIKVLSKEFTSQGDNP